MPVTAFEGPAGTGKTHSLMAHLATELNGRTLAGHERVLATTFMHGSRRRLDSRLREVDGLNGRFEATTLDSFAWRLVQRWRALARSLGHAIPAEDRYDETCALASILMARPAVKSWVSMSYPLILVDEAQDLSAERSGMIAAMADRCTLLLAYDEFQCLNPTLRPMPTGAWLPGVCTPTRLTRCRRTEDAELLAAAGAVREGRAVPRGGRRFRVMLTPGKPIFAATCVANAIAWRNGGTVAILTPSRSGGFAAGVVDLVCAGPVGKQRNGPFPIQWETGEQVEDNALWQRLAMPEACSVQDALVALAPHCSTTAVRDTRDWIVRRRRVLGIAEVTAAQIRGQLNRTLAGYRRHGTSAPRSLSAMTIQQAKNREFDHVIVLWPFTVPNDNEQKRRLLYNAITRAQRSCHVLVQGLPLLDAPPFVPERL